MALSTGQIQITNINEPLVAVLSRESFAFPGSTTAAIAGSTTFTVNVLRGTTKLPVTIGTITTGISGITAAVVPASQGGTDPVVTVTVTTSLTTKSGTFNIPIAITGKAKNISVKLANINK